MPIISYLFFFFLLCVLGLLKLEQLLVKETAPLVRIQKWTLLAASLLFIGYASPWFALILAVQSGITWFCAREEKRVPWGILLMILGLGVFKYTNFFLQSFARLWGESSVPLLKILLPLGISFYTFSAISYLADRKHKKQQALCFSDVALYLCFFPKLTSGPIQRCGDFMAEADRPRTIRWSCLSEGLQIFVFGMFKKLVLADNLSVFVNAVYRAPGVFDSLTVLMAVLSYSMQIYFDFSGYSDMAIGAAKMLDFQLPRNFNLPYLSHNVTELWKRWHITLSSWLQEYLYYPLGGNRKGTLRTYGNLIATMVIGGLWHGANWTYLLWGGLHGMALAVHKIWVQKTHSSQKPHSTAANLLAITVTFLFTSFCWIFFRANSISHAFVIIRSMLSFQPGIRHLYLWTFLCGGILILSGILAAVRSKSGPKGKYNQSPVSGYYPLVDLNSFWGLTAFFVFCGLLLCLAYTGGSPFIYGAY